jgi:thymidylate synthase ThyX
MPYEAKVILDSVGPNGARLTTFELSYPRFVHAELMTHRMFSRNSASSRAIPTEKLVARVMADPAMPVYWGQNERGMQASGELSEVDQVIAYELITSMRDRAVRDVQELGDIGLHKQVANRYIEPWMFITVIVTATHFQNFFDLRDHAKAQPELREVAAKAHALYKSSNPAPLHDGEWHMPYVTGNDYASLMRAGFHDDDVRWISVGRCARVSYLTHDGLRDPNADLTLGKHKMRENGHMSPLEHVAEAMSVARWQAYAAERCRDWVERRIPVGNLWGWGQLRKTIVGEDLFSHLQESPQ